MIWIKKSKIPIINKYVWCNKGNVNIRKNVYSNYEKLEKSFVLHKK